MVIIIVAIGIVAFLTINDELQKDVEKASIQKSINEINSSLAIATYQYIVAGKIQDLAAFDGQNPFIFQAIFHALPKNYKGTIRFGETSLENRSWYYNLDSQEVVYYSKDYPQKFRLVFKYEDNNKNGFFDVSVDDIGGLFLEKKRD